MNAFLQACHERNYSLAWRYIDMREFPSSQQATEGVRVAQELQRVLDRDGSFDLASLSNSPEGNSADAEAADTEVIANFQLEGKSVHLTMTRMGLKSGLQVWLFSATSVPLISPLSRLLGDSIIERYLPGPLVEWTVLDTALWRWAALILLSVVAAAISRIIGQPIILLMKWICRRATPHLACGLLQGLLGPVRLFLGIAIFRAGMEWVAPSALVRRDLERLLALLFFIALAWLGMSIVEMILSHLRSRLAATHHTFSYSVMPLASRLLKITILLLALAAVLSSWGYNTTTIVAGLGIGGLAFALAAQKTIENFFGGVALITDQPVLVGDFCRFGSLVGTVEDVGLRSTRVRTLDRTIVTVPNAEFSTMTLENFSRRDKIWLHITLNLRRDTLPGQVRQVLQRISRRLVDHEKAEVGPLPVRFVGVGTYSLDVEIFAYILTGNFDEFLAIQQELLLMMLDEVQEAGTALAVPTQAYFSLGGEAPQMSNGEPEPALSPKPAR